jgi:hypothetical protein
MNRPVLALLAALTAYPLYAGESLQRKSYSATRIVAAEPPVIDGVLDDACWNVGDWGTGFLQRKPYEGEAPSQDTHFRSTLYVVWSQERGGDGVPGEFAFRDDLRGLFREHPHNVFLVKFSYRFLR